MEITFETFVPWLIPKSHMAEAGISLTDILLSLKGVTEKVGLLRKRGATVTDTTYKIQATLNEPRLRKRECYVFFFFARVDGMGQ